MLVTLNHNFEVTTNEVTFEKYFTRTDVNALFCGLLKSYIEQSIFVVIPYSEFNYQIIANQSGLYDKLKIRLDSHSLDDSHQYFRFVFEFVGYQLPNILNTKNLEDFLYYSYTYQKVIINRQQLPNTGNNLEDILFSIFNVLGKKTFYPFRTWYIGKNHDKNHLFMIEIIQDL